MSRVVERGRLFNALDAARERPLVWISGPPGAGKTCLVTSYVRSRNLPSLWYQVDAPDADPATFFHNLSIASGNAAPRKRKPLPTFACDHPGGVHAFARIFFKAIFSRLPAAALVVFDNVQDAAGEILTRIIGEACTVVPKGAAILCQSRTEPPAKLARLGSQGSIAVLGWEDLRFTDAECKAIAEARGFAGCGDLAGADVDLLLAQVQGWVTGLVLFLEHARVGDASGAASRERGREAIFEYLAAELFADIEPASKHLLLATSLLDEFTPAIAAQLSANPRAARMLRELRRENYFLTRRRSSALIHAYHPLFRDFLQQSARELLKPVALAALQRKAAAILVDSGRMDEAVDLLCKSEAWDELQAVILARAPALSAQGGFALLRRWIEHLPREQRDANPWLLYWHGASLHAFAFAEARQLYGQAFDKFRHQGERAGAFLAWCGIAEAYAMEFSDYTPMGLWLDRVEQMLKESPAFPSRQVEVQVSGSLLYALVFCRPEHPDIRRWNQRVAALLTQVAEDSIRLRLGTSRLFYLMWNGYPREAYALVERLRPTAASARTHPATWIHWHGFEALGRWMLTDFKGCLKAVETGLAIGEASGVHVLDSVLLYQGAYASLSTGELTAAADYLARAEASIAPHSLQQIAQYQFVRGWEAILRGDPELALRHAIASFECVRDLGVAFPLAVAYMAKAVALCELKRFDEAALHAEPIARIAGRMGSRLLTLHHHLLMAEIALGRSEGAPADEWLRKSIRLGREMGEMNHAWWRPKAMARLCARALARGIETDFVVRLIRTRHLQPEQPPLEAGGWPWALRVYTLGRFELVRDGEPLRLAGKAQKRPLEMLKALIALGGRGVGKRQLVAALWPDGGGGMEHRSADTALHRLRRLLGDERFIRFHDGRLDLDPALCWVDLWTFERLLSQAVTAAQLGEIASALRHTEQAVELYQGDFLGREGVESWALPTRERLRRRLLRQLARIAGVLFEAKRYDETVAVCEKALEIDGLAEEFYRNLMECYRCLGRPAEGLAVYQRCRHLLGTVLGAQPSPETRELMARLKQLD